MWKPASKINSINLTPTNSNQHSPQIQPKIVGFAKVKTVIEAAGLNKRKYPAWVAQGWRVAKNHVTIGKLKNLFIFMKETRF